MYLEMLYHDFAKDCPGSFKATIRDKTRPFHSSSALLDAKALPSPKRKKHKFSSGLIVIHTNKFYFPLKVTSYHVLSFKWE